MARRSKVIFCLLLAFLYVVVNVCPLRAEALPDVLSGNTTVADCIMSYYSMVGCAVADNEWITNLYGDLGNSFGTIYDFAENGLLTINNDGTWSATSELTQAIESTSVYTSLGLDEMFNISSEEAATGGGLAAASGGAVLSGAVAGVGSTGVLPVLGGVTAAYWGGIALGTLAAHALGLYGKKVHLGASIDALNSAVNMVPDGGYLFSGAGYGVQHGYIYYSVPSGVYGFTRFHFDDGVEAEGAVYQGFIYNSNDYTVTVTYTAQNGRQTNYDITAKNGRSITSYHGYTDAMTVTPYAETLTSLRNNFDNIDIKKPFSPDIIGENGNQNSETNGNGYTVPDIKPMIDPQTQAGKPLSLQDWLNFANSVKNNNSSADPFGNNASLFDNIMDLIVTGNPNNPDPDPDPDPWSPPVVNPVPDPTYPDPVPDQPTSENPQESENPQQTEPLDPVDTGRPWMLPDLKNKFPFCIPWDIKDCFTLLKSNIRQAPHISWRFNPPNTPIDYTFNLDLSDFDPVATLLRTLELIAFIVGLAFATRYLIGAS